MATTEALVEVNELFQRMCVLFIAIVIINEGSIVCLTTFSAYELQNVNFSTSLLKCFRWWRHLKGYYRNTVDSRYCGHPRGEGGGVGGDLVSVVVRVHKARVDWNQEITIVYDERRWKLSIISEIYVVKKGELQFQKRKKNSLNFSRSLSTCSFLSHLVVTPS